MMLYRSIQNHFLKHHSAPNSLSISKKLRPIVRTQIHTDEHDMDRRADRWTDGQADLDRSKKKGF